METSVEPKNERRSFAMILALFRMPLNYRMSQHGPGAELEGCRAPALRSARLVRSAPSTGPAFGAFGAAGAFGAEHWPGAVKENSKWELSALALYQPP